MDLFVNFVADVVKAFFDENDFVNVIKLREEEFSLVVVDWLQILENLDHEVLVLKVAPWVETMLVSRILIGDAKVVPETL